MGIYVRNKVEKKVIIATIRTGLKSEKMTQPQTLNFTSNQSLKSKNREMKALLPGHNLLTLRIWR